MRTALKRLTAQFTGSLFDSAPTPARPALRPLRAAETASVVYVDTEGRSAYAWVGNMPCGRRDYAMLQRDGETHYVIVARDRLRVADTN